MDSDNREFLLEVRNLTQCFGGLKAVDGINLNVSRGEIVSVIGPNGAGKTTFFNVLTGVYEGTSGDIIFRNESIRGLPSHQIVEKGIARTFQNIRLFPDMTALENVMVGRHVRSFQFLSGPLFQTRQHQIEEEKLSQKATELLEFVGIQHWRGHRAKQLSYGVQRKLEIARALASDPQLLILDEPTAGMNLSESNELVSLVRKIQQHGITVLLIEHQMKVVMNISNRVVVFDYGLKISEGKPKEVVSDPRVIEAYLGQSQV